MLQPKPHSHQQENHVISSAHRWTKSGVVSWDSINTAVEDPGGPLWENSHSTFNGLNDKVPEDLLKRYSRSLYIVRPTGLVLSTSMEGGVFGPAKRKTRAEFELCGHSYHLAVTDPTCADTKDGKRAVKDALICVSLSEAYKGFAFKLAAGIITPKARAATS